MKREENESIVIVGAGAAGLACALFLAKGGKKVTILEKEAQVGRKLSISGGSHANFTNTNASSAYYVPENTASFIDKSLALFDFQKSLKLVERLGLVPVEKRDGQFFLRQRATKLVEALSGECERNGVEIACNQKAISIDWPSRQVFTENACFKGNPIILAQGSPAGLKLSNAATLRLATALGHQPVPFTQALVPFNFNRDYKLKSHLASLAGISMPVELTLLNNSGNKRFSGSLLFTHRGLSGPAILNVSLYWLPGNGLQIDFLPGENFELLLDEFPKQTPLSTARRKLPARFCEILLPEEKGKIKNGQLSRNDRRILAALIHKFTIREVHKAEMKFAEVCKGGVPARELDAATMQSRLKNDLYIIGEMTEITGQLGGYNLQWAWTSAFCAARSICGPDLDKMEF